MGTQYWVSFNLLYVAGWQAQMTGSNLTKITQKFSLFQYVYYHIWNQLENV